jgi:predicted PurR-regulated permease PerM
LADSFTAFIAQLRVWLDVGPPGPPAWLESVPLIGRRAFHRWQEIATSSATFQAALEPHLGWMQVQMLNVAGGLVGGIVLLLLSLLLTFFMYLNGSVLAEHIHHGLGRVIGARGRHMESIVGSTMRSVVYGVLGTNFIQAMLATLGFVVVGVPGAVLLGLICFFLTLIPFGCNLVWVPIAAWLAVDGNIGWSIGFAVYNIVLFGPFETAMRAYIIGRNSEMPLILLLMGMLGGLTIFGLLGLLIGPTLLAVGFALVYEWSAAPKPTATPVGDLVEAPGH